MKDLSEKLVVGVVLVLSCWLWVPSLIAGVLVRLAVEAFKLGWKLVKV